MCACHGADRAALGHGFGGFRDCLSDDFCEPAGGAWFFGRFSGGGIWRGAGYRVLFGLRGGDPGDGGAFRVRGFGFLLFAGAAHPRGKLAAAPGSGRHCGFGAVFGWAWIVKYLADPLRQLPEITFWMLGSLASVTWSKFLAVLPACLLCLGVIFSFRWRLNLLALDETTAFSLGAAPRRERLIMMIAAVLATSAMISVAGMVGWIGLITPHIARRLVSRIRAGMPVADPAGRPGSR